MSTSLDPRPRVRASIDFRQSCSSRLLWGRRGVPQRFHDGGAFKVSARPYFGERQAALDAYDPIFTKLRQAQR